MPVTTKETLKGYFKLGRAPSEEEFAELIDSIPETVANQNYDNIYLKLDASNGPLTNDLNINGVIVGHGPQDIYTNTIVGDYAMHNFLGNEDEAGYNTAIGTSSLANNIDGIKNTAVGFYSLLNSKGNFNTAIGNDASIALMTGEGNTSLGHQSLSQNESGNYNVAIGLFAGAHKSDGVTSLLHTENSIYVGANSKGLDDNDINTIVIGCNATSLGANSTAIGNSETLRSKLFGTLNCNQKTPASSSAPGIAGDICWDSNYVYVCTALNTWKRSSLTSW